MRDGDLVRYREILEHGVGLHRPTIYSKWIIGVLFKYDKLMKIAEIISPSGDLVRIRAADVQLVQRANNKHKKT